MSKQALRLRLDHAGVVGRSADDLAETFRLLGFQVVGPVELMGLDSNGKAYSLNQRSAHVMFRDTYIELTSVESPPADHHLAPYLGPPAGVRLLILATDNIVRTQARCQAVSLNPSEIGLAARDIGYGQAGTARFKWFGLPAEQFPEGLVGYVEHQTPKVVFQESVAIHANGAVGLSGVLMRAGNEPSQLEALASSDGSASLQILSRSDLSERFHCTMETPPLAGLSIQVTDLDQTGEFLESRGIRHQRLKAAIAVPPDCAAGVGLIFET